MAIHLYRQISNIVKETETEAVAISFYDYETETSWCYQGDTFFHAASTIKVAIMMCVFALIDEGRVRLDSPVHVRNRFLSLADNKAYRVQSSRDACSTLYSSLGQSLTVEELAYHMIVTSSNMATNLLIDLFGVSALHEKLDKMGVQGIVLKRGVEDELAYEAGINNLATANGLLQLFRYLYENRGISTDLTEKMLQILSDQKFNQGLPVGIPQELRKLTRFAHKTGEISTVAHDTGLVFLPDRKPYALTILTERVPGRSKSRKAIQQLSKLVYKNFINSDIRNLVKDAC